MEHNPLRGLFGVSSPRPVEQIVAPQPTEPTENVYFEIPLGMCDTQVFIWNFQKILFDLKGVI